MTGDWLAIDALSGQGWQMRGAEVQRAFALDGGALPDLPIVACGIGGVPAMPVPTIPLHLAAGAQQKLLAPLIQSDTGAVTMGHEARIIGWLRAAGDWDGAICLCHSRTIWAHVSAGEVIGLRASLTGEISDFLADGQGEGGDFDAAVADGYARPEQLLSRLATTSGRAAQQGLLIGADLAGAKHWWLGQDIVVIGPRADAYARALAQLGASPRTAPDDATTLAGLIAAAGR
ncbi:2-dehydro-3-deoxygalactonokinase [Ketogulonicigenium vulgare]|uniref:2-dehydro-3-deoxygalactonokinase, putative n=1 Tax=Ketogulonicigenium vulgare (strain WSH-001) TaxID=759362 RepID=F9Y9Z6_KETVW|nr:2-dehydro-3-deoxygalactonokinase [Ketogulonicigenium vulgare]ADO42029.1 2-dehydro-3-deoxygalactonokinase [Ketogulonicigenium vulgare Y25]AEM40248.1 2-dehydro-3-deoxygalactonokinase, putative [Ketogulonicigenium vulgare WSH-001]ALJ80449.1 2-dehydro-3-deoxygalactonokinase [Ketogulonicigenium vulgare]ANW33276.1 2-dehydro-3-deoxygalactonokinase [Ketogulonicigenium vulgare]AOZ53955.1 2-dehydro-3-deoxygalactonokinase [Ketogulonicigenium vulgare]